MICQALLKRPPSFTLDFFQKVKEEPSEREKCQIP
jgi:hypothetical protein